MRSPRRRAGETWMWPQLRICAGAGRGTIIGAGCTCGKSSTVL